MRILGKTGKLRTRMCAGGSELCTAAYSFHGLKGVTREGRFFVANDTYAEGSSFGAASWTLAMHTGEKNIFGEPRSKCGRRDARDVKFRSADVVEAGSRRSADIVVAGSWWTWRGSA